MSNRYSTQQIVTGCLKKDRRLQRVLVDQYSGLLYGICVRYLRVKEEARDGLQESLMRIFDNLHKYDAEKGNFESWISTITIHHCLNKLKKKKLLQVSNEDELSLKASYEIETDILSAYDYLQLAKLIADLPEVYGTVFNLSAIDGYSHKEIAQLLGISEVASRTRLNRAKNKLKAQIIRLKNFESWVDTM